LYLVFLYRIFLKKLNFKIMRTIRRITVMSIVIFSAIFCFAQFGPKKTVAVCNKCHQTAATASIPEAEDFSLVSLLTLKFM